MIKDTNQGMARWVTKYADCSDIEICIPKAVDRLVEAGFGMADLKQLENPGHGELQNRFDRIIRKG